MEGYAKIASRIAAHPELGIYRRFAALNAQNILYLQAELHGLEQELQQYAAEDTAASDDEARKLYSRDWQTLAESTDNDRRQWNTVCRIRGKLKDYSKWLAFSPAYLDVLTFSDDCLVQQAIINSGFQAPRSYNLDTLRSCLRDPKLPDYLLGRDSDIWEDAVLQDDLIAADLSKDKDSMTVWIAANLVAPFHQLIGRHFVNPSDHSAGLYNYSDGAITKVSSLLATVLSSVLPIAGVVVLYFVENTLARIGIIAGMTASFSLCLSLLTSARKSEIFAATAAFSAVLVVFLGCNN